MISISGIITLASLTGLILFVVFMTFAKITTVVEPYEIKTLNEDTGQYSKVIKYKEITYYNGIESFHTSTIFLLGVLMVAISAGFWITSC